MNLGWDTDASVKRDRQFGKQRFLKLLFGYDLCASVPISCILTMYKYLVWLSVLTES